MQQHLYPAEQNSNNIPPFNEQGILDQSITDIIKNQNWIIFSSTMHLDSILRMFFEKQHHSLKEYPDGDIDELLFMKGDPADDSTWQFYGSVYISRKTGEINDSLISQHLRVIPEKLKEAARVALQHDANITGEYISQLCTYSPPENPQHL